MNFLRKYYLVLSISVAAILGFGSFVISYRDAKGVLIEQRFRTLRVVTNVKLNLLERKLYSVEQQLSLLSKNNEVNRLLTASSLRGAPGSPEFDAYIKGMLYNQGCSDLLLVDRQGVLVFSLHPEQDAGRVSSEIRRFATAGSGGRDSTLRSNVLLSVDEPKDFYVGKRVTGPDGNSLGALFIEVPNEFLSIELHNTVSWESLTSYLISPEGILNQSGQVDKDTCSSCRWDPDAFISFSPETRVGGTWTLMSVYPVSEIDFQQARYISALDGMIAVFVAAIIAILVAYSIQLAQRSKGITTSDTLLVQTTWNAVSEFSTKIIAGFYKYLFASAPEVRPLFKSNQAVQEKRMALMINTIVNSADSLDEFRGSISQLAKSHTHMGVKREYFPIVVNALINSVADQYGERFTSAHRKAWLKILGQVSAIMIDEMESYQRTLRESAARRESDAID